MKHNTIRKFGASLLVAAGLCTPAVAVQIAHYDLAPASGTSLAPTSTLAPFTASALVLVNGDNTASAFGNHFYHNNWDATLNTSKYYQNTIGAGGSAFTLSGVDFSLENFFGISDYFLRSSLDGFSGNIATGSFAGGLVTNFGVDLSSLGVIGSDITFRWYMTGTGQSVGFANHEPGGAGAGLPDIGQDLRFSGQLATGVPDGGTTAALLGLALLGFVAVRRKF